MLSRILRPYNLFYTLNRLWALIAQYRRVVTQLYHISNRSHDNRTIYVPMPDENPGAVNTDELTPRAFVTALAALDHDSGTWSPARRGQAPWTPGASPQAFLFFLYYFIPKNINHLRN